MKIVKKIDELREIISDWKKAGYSVGLVPTMGYLHEGHASLIERAARENDKVIVSDFVNPIQFGPNEDLSTYPRDIELDSRITKAAGGDIIFYPEKEEMYYKNSTTFIDMTGPTDLLCGASRAGHFRGVCTVVAKLFLITKADRAYFGKKDAQQLAVIKRMVRDLNFDIEIIGCEIIREEDGLAKSSRNVYLNEDERRAALILNKALTEGKKLILNGEKDAIVVEGFIKKIIEGEKLAKIDYVSVVSFPDIKKINKIEGEILVAIAVYIGKTRLIDNFILGE